MELSPILSITVGQIEKTRFLVNLKYHKIIISFFILHRNTTNTSVTSNPSTLVLHVQYDSISFLVKFINCSQG